MTRLPSNSTGISKTPTYRRKKQWREGPDTVKHKTNNAPPLPNPSLPAPQQPHISPSLPITPIPATPPASPIIPVPPPTHSPVQTDIHALLSGQLSNETKRAYRADLKHFLTFIHHPEALDDMKLLPKVLIKVDRQLAASYRDHMMAVEKRAAATVNRRLATINVVFNSLMEEGVIVKNPFSWVKRPKVSNAGKTPAFTKEQAESIIAQPDATASLGKRDRIILLLLFFCGLRRSEVVKVEVGDFYQNQGHVLLKVHGKGRSDKSDAVMVPDQIWSEIQDFIKDKDGLLFTARSRNTRYNRADTPISANRVYLLFKQYCRMAGIDANVFSPHSTRATYITLCLSGGADVRSVMYAARHSDPSTTIRYDRQRMDIENHASRYLTIKTNSTPENHP